MWFLALKEEFKLDIWKVPENIKKKKSPQPILHDSYHSDTKAR